jgi:transcriptional regulator with XRE-family HTH domain
MLNGNILQVNSIGKAIKLRFGKANPVLSQSIYKDVLGVPKKTFRKYVNNEKQPRIDELQRIATWLGVKPKDLF